MLTRWTDEQVEDAVGNLLRAGVLIAAAVTLAGAIAYLWHHGTTRVDYHIWRGEPAELRDLGSIIRSAFSLHSLGVIQLGLVLLILTPIARVALSLFGFVRQADRTYVLITGLVLAILIFSLAGGRV